MRVNNVRKAFEFGERDAKRHPRFFDSSLWEERKLTSREGIKNLIRYGVGHTSVVCVLVGHETWQREWVRYEIARAVVDKRGLLAVHLNGINHHRRLRPDQLGPNPLHFMGVYKKARGILSEPTWHLCELTADGWIPYANHTAAVDRPRYLPDAAFNVAMPLSMGTKEHCYAGQLGSLLIGRWIDDAAKAVGR
ncbi:TIR domain-containing protein [Bosea sp. LjRoot237]|uniref:TIR domain-containing protein n=1 Tax=Bosea sp. LjRoot237 TaxID=3342292 RepID=UPI003F50678A